MLEYNVLELGYHGSKMLCLGGPECGMWHYISNRSTAWECWHTSKKEVISFQGSMWLSKNTLPRWRVLIEAGTEGGGGNRVSQLDYQQRPQGGNGGGSLALIGTTNGPRLVICSSRSRMASRRRMSDKSNRVCHSIMQYNLRWLII